MRYIDADKLSTHKFTTQEASHNDMGGAYRQGWNDAIDAVVDNEPTADVRENVHGMYVKNTDNEYICIVCGIVFEDFYEKEPPFNFCPNCGAQMERR